MRTTQKKWQWNNKQWDDNRQPLLCISISLSTAVYFAVANGFFSTRMTESPLRNILEMKRSLFTGFDFFLPLPVFGTSVHISFTFSSTMLQCLWKESRKTSVQKDPNNKRHRIWRSPHFNTLKQKTIHSSRRNEELIKTKQRHDKHSSDSAFQFYTTTVLTAGWTLLQR